MWCRADPDGPIRLGGGPTETTRGDRPRDPAEDLSDQGQCVTEGIRPPRAWAPYALPCGGTEIRWIAVPTAASWARFVQVAVRRRAVELQVLLLQHGGCLPGIDLVEEVVHDAPVEFLFLEDRRVGTVMEQDPPGVGQPVSQELALHGGHFVGNSGDDQCRNLESRGAGR